MFRGSMSVVPATAMIMLVTLLGVPSTAAEPPQAQIELSYRERCDDVGATLKPPTARLVDAAGAPIAGETLTWTWREVYSVVNFGEPHEYGSAVTNASGEAEVEQVVAPLDRPVLWHVVSSASSEHAAGTNIGYQRRLGLDTSLQPRAQVRSTTTSPNAYGSWSATGFDVTQNGVGEGLECPRIAKTGAAVDVQYRAAGTNQWLSGGTTTVDEAGRWSLLFLPGSAGDFEIRGVIAADRGAPSYPSSAGQVTIHPGFTTLRPAKNFLDLTGARQATLSYTLGISSIQHGPWRPAAQKRSAELWFTDQHSKRTSLVRAFTQVPVVGGKAVFAHRTTVKRSGTYVLRFDGAPIERPAAASTAVTVNPTLRGWPSNRKRSTLGKNTPRARTVTAGWLQSSKQRVLLLERRGRSSGYNTVKSLKPNSRGKVTIKIPRGWRGKRDYKVFVGDVRYLGGNEIVPARGTTSGRWTVTRK